MFPRPAAKEKRPALGRLGGKVAPPPRSRGVLGSRGSFCASASRGSSVLGGVGQQMALQGFELERPHPKAAPGHAGVHRPCNQKLFEERGSVLAAGTCGPLSPCGEPQPCLAERARSKVKRHRHQRTRALGLGSDSLCAEQGACYFRRTQPKLRVPARCPPSGSGLPKTHLLGILVRNPKTLLSWEAQGQRLRLMFHLPPS